MVVGLESLWDFQSHSEIHNGLLLTDVSVPGPDIINLNLIKGLDINLFTNAQRHQVRSPVPTVLVAGFSCVCVVKWHWVCALAFAVVLLGRFYFDLEFVLPRFKVLVDVYCVLSECVFSC